MLCFCLIRDSPAHPALQIPRHPSQGLTEVMNVHNMLSNGDTPMCQIWYAYVQLREKTILLRHEFMVKI